MWCDSELEPAFMSAASCGVTQANREPESTSIHEPTSSQPRVKSIFLNFAPQKISEYQENI